MTTLHPQTAEQIRAEIARLYEPIACEVCGKSIVYARKLPDHGRFQWKCSCGNIFPPMVKR